GVLPGVVGAAGERMFEWHYADGPIMVNSLDPSYFRDPAFGRWPLVGPRSDEVWEAVARGEAALASENFVVNVGARVGDTIELETPSGPCRLRIAGIAIAMMSPRGELFFSRDLYRTLWNDDQVSRVFVRVRSEAGVGAVRTAITRALGGKYSLR